MPHDGTPRLNYKRPSKALGCGEDSFCHSYSRNNQALTQAFVELPTTAVARQQRRPSAATPAPGGDPTADGERAEGCEGSIGAFVALSNRRL